MDIITTELQTEERLPWHKPEIQRLVVTVDTKGTVGSGSDGGVFEFVE